MHNFAISISFIVHSTGDLKNMNCSVIQYISAAHANWEEVHNAASQEII